MSLLTQWTAGEARFGIWKMDEEEVTLRAMLFAPFPYEAELLMRKAPSRRMEYLGARVLLRTLCGEEKRVMYRPSGAPYLADGSGSLTISHTGSYVAVGIHPSGRVAVDIERMSPRVLRVADRFMHPDEQVAVPVSGEADTLHYLLLHWSAKETLFKLLDCDDVDFQSHLRLFPFPLQESGTMTAREYRTADRGVYTLRYRIFPDFVCTYCVAK